MIDQAGRTLPLTDRQAELLLDILEGVHAAMLEEACDRLDSAFEEDVEEGERLMADTTSIGIIILNLRWDFEEGNES